MATNIGTVNVNLLLGTCKTCKWWGFEKESVTNLHKTIAKACGFPKADINEDGYEAVTGDKFGLDYPVCDLITRPNFGCVHHEARNG